MSDISTVEDRDEGGDRHAKGSMVLSEEVSLNSSCRYAGGIQGRAEDGRCQ